MALSEVINGYLNRRKPEDTDTARCLRQIAEQCGAEVFLDREKLEAQMRGLGMAEVTVMQVLLMTSVTGFKDVVEGNERAIENDIDRFVGNAQDETGLSRQTVLYLAADIAAALGYPVVTEYDRYLDAKKAGKSYVVPGQLYEKELGLIRRKQQRQESLTEAEKNTLTHFAEAGIPEAQFYLSQYMEESNPQQAQELLLQAAQQGSMEALAKLGDSCYQEEKADSWEKAYEYYTGYGAAAVSRSRHLAMKNILNHKKYNLKMLQLTFLIVVAMAAMAIMQPAAPLYGMHGFWRFLFPILDAGVWTVAVLHYRAHPFAFMKWLVPAMTGIWGLYLIIWLL